MKKIAILICYYGKFPWYFPIFLHTCKYNSTINFLIVTDIEYNKVLPSNVSLVKRSINEIVAIASEKMGFIVTISNPYKLCDFKPTYGLIFSDLLSKYDFWGHGDIDLIFGNIRNFITDNMLDTYDLISVRHDFLTGYFLLFRNCSKMNELFMLSPDYKKVFTNPHHYCFDETNFAFDSFTDGISPDNIFTDVKSMSHIVITKNADKFINAYFDFHVIEGLPGKLKWNEGTLIYKNKYEVLLYHMIVFKRFCKPRFRLKGMPSNFRISTSRIY